MTLKSKPEKVWPAAADNCRNKSYFALQFSEPIFSAASWEAQQTAPFCKSQKEDKFERVFHKK